MKELNKLDIEKLMFMTNLIRNQFSIEEAICWFLDEFGENEFKNLLAIDESMFLNHLNSNFKELSLDEVNKFFSFLNMKLNAIPK